MKGGAINGAKTLADPQEELPFSSVKAHAVFPGRTTLYLHEVASKLHVTVNHLITLIEKGEIRAINIASNVKGGVTPSGRTKARFYRLPVDEYDALIERGRSDK